MPKLTQNSRFPSRLNFPDEIIVYVCDTINDGGPVYAVATSVEDLPEDAGELADDRVAVYTINREWGFKVKRILE